MAGYQRQLCLSCHPAHYTERGRCNDCHLGNPASERKNIAHAGFRKGKHARFTLGEKTFVTYEQHLMDQLACRRCHISAGRGNRLAVSLDGAAVRRTAGELALSIKQPVANMPDFALNEEQVTTLVNAILDASQGRNTDKSAPVGVHFITSGKKNPDVFSTKCGGCHRILSERCGAIGISEIGPNLSGLFSTYYPKTFKNNGAWTIPNMNTWLKNPREIRRWSKMQPVALTEVETKELVSIITVSPESHQ